MNDQPKPAPADNPIDWSSVDVTSTSDPLNPLFNDLAAAHAVNEQLICLAHALYAALAELRPGITDAKYASWQRIVRTAEDTLKIDAAQRYTMPQNN